MVTFSPESLRNIKRFDQLVAYLRDELDWPIGSEDFDDLTFDYEPEELGIDPKNAAKIEIIKQLRPLVSNQPWGIFWIKFKPKRLPVVALRRILGQLVTKKRATAGKAGLPTWKLDDLMLISAIGEEDERQITFAHFADDAANGLPTLRVLGWDDDDTLRKLDWVERQLKSHLTWPDGGTSNEWRMQWRQAFILRHREVPKTTKELVAALAELAQAIRKRANTAIALETEHGPLRKLHTAFQDSLIHDLSHDGFADMYAQTIAYGLLSARISRPAGLVAEDAALMVPRTNPFLRELMEEFLRIGGRQKDAPNGGIDFDELGVNDIVELLRKANMEAVITDFGRARPGEDPVIHFYEDFMKAYDAKQRVKRGIYYTPIPIVSFIVRSVDEILREEFGLPLGLADTTTWAEMKRRFDAGELPSAAPSAASEDGPQADAELREFTIPQGVSENDPFVQILDPAVGTGTFLVEAIDLIHNRMKEHWLAEGHMELELEELWNEYVEDHLLPRLYGFELLMAPYAICHMKVGLKLADTGYRFRSSQRLRVYLTNSLEPPQDLSEMLEFVAPFLAHEARAANVVKDHLRPTIVIGNPPYSVSSWNTGKWITNLTEDYKRTVREEESQIQSLSNDYIKFLRLAEWLIEQTRSGVIGMITGHGYLHGTQPRDLRSHLSSTFARCLCLDLHGSIRRAGTADDDEPVFEIMTGVAIIVASAIVASPGRGATALASLTGPLASKFSRLGETTASCALDGGTLHTPELPHFHFSPPLTEKSIANEYHQWMDLTDIFGTGDRQADKETFWATGLASQQDDLAISFSRSEVAEKMQDLAASRSFAELNEKYRLCTTNQWSYDDAVGFARRGPWQNYISQVVYRPFDRRWTVLHKNVLTILRSQVMSQLTGDARRNLGLISSRAVNDIVFAHCFVTREPVDKIFISSKTSTNAYVFPLYVNGNGLDGGKRRPNFSQKFLRVIGSAIASNTRGTVDVGDALETESVFQYIYGTLHSAKYRDRYGEFLKIDFPRIPLPVSGDVFHGMASLGGDLVALHLLEDDYPYASWNQPGAKNRNPLAHPITTFHDAPGNDREVRKVGEKSKMMAPSPKGEGLGRVYINESAYFDGVPEEVWNFHIGGYQVCHKWLSDRKRKGGKNPRPGRVLTDEDIDHYQKIVVALNETIRIMAEIDEVIETHGGWPDAFVTDRCTNQAQGDMA